jgi:hypothetical protein
VVGARGIGGFGGLRFSVPFQLVHTTQRRSHRLVSAMTGATVVLVPLRPKG